MDQWLRQRLLDCLDFQVPDEMIEYIFTLNEPHLVDEYFETLLDFEKTEHRLFLNDFKQRIFKKSAPTGNTGSKPVKKNPLSDLKPSNKKKDDKSNKFKAQPPSVGSSEPPPPHPESTGTKKKTKFVNMYSADGLARDVVLLKGRHHCDCQATKHKLINNCLRCGRIVCQQEGSGPCLFCGNLVCSEDELSVIESSSKKGESLKRSLLQQQRPKGWEEAMAMRNKLLQFDREGVRRTTVIDDESDYFKANSVWLSDAERKKMQQLEQEVAAKKHATRLSTRVTLDFAGRQVVEEARQTTADFEDELLREIDESTAINAGIEHSMRQSYAGASDDVHPMLDFPAPVFDNAVSSSRGPDEGRPKYDGVYSRVQDKELLEISDQKCCMSMHQPYASLLVAGIKRHEGRSWYTAHRGRLWIAATAKPVDVDEVKRLEDFYRLLYDDQTIEFPLQYPSGCLLGCVLVQDCLPQEDYRKLHPKGESESPFVFVCNEPQELAIRFPVRGEHKIYKLDQTVHMAASKAMLRASKLQASSDA